MYKSKLNIKDTQKAIKLAKDTFEIKLTEILNLDRVSAPIVVFKSEMINDDLGLKDSAIKFRAANLDDEELEIVQSLAKWKRIALSKYGYQVGEGIYTDMNALRPKDELDEIHSLYVDQWDWELIIKPEERTLDFLYQIVNKIIYALKETKKVINQQFKVLNEEICSQVFFITSQELKELYPDKSLIERENLITKLHKTVFISQISPLDNESLRAPDYDDWQLNGDILVWSNVLNQAIEISSMGIRVDEKALVKQVKLANRGELLNGNYHQMIINQELPLTIGGGIGQSRLCMILLEKSHIAEVQASVWSEEEKAKFEKNNLQIL